LAVVKNGDITCDVLYLYDEPNGVTGVKRTALEERTGHGSGKVLNDKSRACEV